uniref:NADH-ubiquinone oxidoreductase chain 4 n=1 Tax=Janus sp. 1 GYN-2022e TaxID=3003421 RepID=A0A9E9BXJ4_9HYME|nr:NADH dehydrogenase subunit 4 [Janus sp. 1 GYN-2022e]
MVKYFIFVVMLIMIIYMMKGGLKMIHILFQNLILLLFLSFFFEFSFMSFNFFDFSSLQYFYGLDYFSFWMIILSMWVIVLMMLASGSVVKMNKFLYLFVVNLLIMLLFLIFAFSVLNFFLFYFFFEASLIPTMLLVLGWGYQIERVNAVMYMIMYTMFFSFPFLVGILYVFYDFGSVDIILLGEMKIEIDFSYFYYLMTNIFFVKMPMFSIHGWLPKAHVEAPVAGSMILAGVMLKLGGYGLYRILFIFEDCWFDNNLSYLIFSLVGGVYLSFVCIWQVDMKAMVAYSSVVHMSLVIGGLLSLGLIGVHGAFMMMLAHGLCSSGMFCMVNMIYERTLSRSLVINKGLLIYSPVMMMMWFFLCVGNMSAPPSLNLISEIFLLISLISVSGWLFILLMVIMFVNSCYSLYLYSYVCYGGALNWPMFHVFSVREYMVILMHLVPLNLLIMSINFF